MKTDEIRFRCDGDGQPCNNIITIPSDCNEFMIKCIECGQFTNILKGLKAIQVYKAGMILLKILLHIWTNSLSIKLKLYRLVCIKRGTNKNRSLLPLLASSTLTVHQYPYINGKTAEIVKTRKMKMRNLFIRPRLLFPFTKCNSHNYIWVNVLCTLIFFSLRTLTC